MNAGKLKLLISSMILAVSGIIGLQAYWLVHSYRLKQIEFDRLIMEALMKTSARLERGEQAFFVQQVIHDDVGLPGESLKINLMADSTTQLPRPEELESVFRKLIVINQDTVINRVNKTVYRTLSAGVKGKETDIDRVMKKLSRLEKKTGEVQEVVKQLAFEMENKDEPLIKRVPPDKVRKFLLQELQERSLPEASGFTITDGDKKNVYQSQKADSTLKQYTVRLFPGAIEQLPAYLTVVFPGQNKHLLLSMVWLFSLSGFFSLFMIVVLFIAVLVMVKQKKMNEIRNDFINNMTHEFKTPLATISLAADAMMNERVQADADKLTYYARRIKEENKRMNEQVEQVLNMALIEKEGPDTANAPCLLRNLLNEVTERYSLNAEAVHGNLVLELQDETIKINCNRFHLLKAIGNIVDNAIKYSGGTPEITIRAGRKNMQVLISVTDNGIGISKEHLDRIFEKFYRVSTGNIHEVKGFGLGLSYARHIVVSHGGRIEVQSEPGKGSVFNIYLPCM